MPVIKGHIVWCHLYELFSIGNGRYDQLIYWKLRHTKRLMEMGFWGGGWYKYLKMRKCWQLYNSVNILPATELFHFQWVNFLEISWLFNKHINKEKEKNDTWCTVDSTFMWSRIMMRTWCFPLILKCCFLFYPLEHMAFQQLFQSLLTGCK